MLLFINRLATIFYKKTRALIPISASSFFIKNRGLTSFRCNASAFFFEKADASLWLINALVKSGYNML